MTLTPKVKVIGKKVGICDGVPSTAALVFNCVLVVIWLLISVSLSRSGVGWSVFLDCGISWS